MKKRLKKLPTTVDFFCGICYTIHSRIMGKQDVDLRTIARFAMKRLQGSKNVVFLGCFLHAKLGVKSAVKSV